MEIFKVYLKICQKKISVIIIYIVIFSGVLYLFSQEEANSSKTFTNTKVKTVFYNQDEGSILASGMYDFLSNYCEFEEIPESQIDDAMFMREVEYVIEIQEGFEESFLRGEDVFIKKQSIPDSFSTMTINGVINNYLNTARVLNRYMALGSSEELVAVLKQCMASGSDIAIFDPMNSANDNSFYETYFNYYSYIMIACFISIIGMIMTTFQHLPIKRRNLVAPISIHKLNINLLLCNLSFAVLFYILFMAFGVIISKTHTINSHYLLFAANAFIFSLIGLAVSYLFGVTLKTNKAISLISTVFSLGFAFLGGVFVPPEMMDKTARAVSKLVPSYWYVLTNNKISLLTNFNWESVSEVLNGMLLQLGMVLILFIASFIISSIRKKQEN